MKTKTPGKMVQYLLEAIGRYTGYCRLAENGFWYAGSMFSEVKVSTSRQVEPAIRDGWAVVVGRDLLLTDAGKEAVDPEQMMTGWYKVGDGWKLP